MASVPFVYFGAIFLLIATLSILLIILLNIRKKLKEKEIRLTTVIESQPECVKLQDKDGYVLEMNQAGLNLLEVENATDVLGKTVYEFISSEHHPQYKQLTENVFNGMHQSMTFKIRGQKGTERWLESNAVPLRDQNKQITALLAITRDVTERMQLERKLQKRQLELDHVCKVSTMGEVASGIAHELNQPLCAISSYAETCNTLLKTNDSGSESISETLNLISEQAQRASQIVSWIRSLASKRDMNFTEVDLNELLVDVKLMINYFLEQHKTNLILQTDKNLPLVIGDRVQLEHVFINLIKNATEAMPNDFRRREIYINAQSNSDNNVLVSVKDNGGGISEQNRSQVLNPYFTTKRDGLGMGLSICRSIIKAHKGNIWIKESNNLGTEFIFSLSNVNSVSNLEKQYA